VFGPDNVASLGTPPQDEFISVGLGRRWPFRLNLTLDFDFIERSAGAGAPRYMQWYAAFGLMLSLIWIYVSVLRVLALLRARQ
jgi:Bax inhibitor 1 like